MTTQLLIPGYSRTARFLHWATALTVLMAIFLGLAAESAEDAAKGEWFFWHKSFGILVLFIVTLRVLHRLVRGVPPPHPHLPPLERQVSLAVHLALYALLLALPLLGWLGMSAFGRPPSFFGLFTLPPLVEKTPDLGEQALDMHVIAAFILIALAALHIAAGLYHGLIRRDGVLMRMISGDTTQVE